ncbi:MAG: MFS transporter [Hyphomicrobiaceae bacterium]|nr:MFS transporter [Hyphomicrobiaceae bacterium]
MTMSFINWISFAAWQALLNNFVVERAGFQWSEIGLTQSVREIPGFLAFTAIFWLAVMREQTLAYVSLLVLGLGIALTGFFPTLTGVLITTFIMSVGFHYFETMNTSLQLQILPKAEAGRLMGRIASAGAAGQFLAYGGIAAVAALGYLNYAVLYAVIGIAAIAITIAAVMGFGRYEGPVPQRKSIVLRQRYWLYYAMTFMSGARRQLFHAFAGFLLVKKFGFSLTETALLMLVTAALTTVLAGRLGGLVSQWGERRTIQFENVVLILVFAGYALSTNGTVAAILFVIDGVFFTLTIAQRTYFQKIGDPADMAATASVAFTINHIAAVFIPVLFGALGMINPSIIFWLGVVIATMSLALSFLVPERPGPGHETILVSPRAAPAE